MQTFVTHLEGAIDGAKLEAGIPWNTHAQRPIWVRYDLERVRRNVSRDDLAARPASLWRYRELLPVADDANIVSLGETMTPILPCPRLGSVLGLNRLWVKDESRLPTCSFKSRGLAVAVSMCREFGVDRVAIPTAGNAGGALAAYAARAAIDAYVFMPADTPVANQLEASRAGAHVYLVEGLINDCGKIVREGVERMGWFDISTLKEPYRLEGKKTMGFEIAEQFAWTLPDVILYPTGGGTGLIGMCKAFDELAAIGWLESTTRPRMVAVQSSGCAPIVRALDAGERFAPVFPNATTIASGLRVPVAVGDFMIIDAVRASGGTGIAVDDAEILESLGVATRTTGISFCPESAVCIAAARRLAETGWIRPDECVLVINCAGGQKYGALQRFELPRITNPAQPDWSVIAASA